MCAVSNRLAARLIEVLVLVRMVTVNCYCGSDRKRYCVYKTEHGGLRLSSCMWNIDPTFRPY
jgi:hypothetical protein